MDRQASPMTVERWMQLKTIFEAAQGKPPRERAEEPAPGEARQSTTDADRR